MKNLYLIISGLVISLFTFTESNAQCTCSDGSIPDSVQYSQYFDSIIANNNVLSFPQFNPDSGSLQCIRLSDTVTTVVSYNMQNDLDYVEDYVFETFRRSRFEGPGSYVNSITSAPQEYGPYTLQPRDSAGDNISIGPDTVFNKQYQSKYGPPNAAYYGTGTVNFNYLTTSTFTILTGSDNAVFKLSSYTRLFVTLTYYWCPSAILSARVSNFTATNGGDHISLGWESDHGNQSEIYEIEVSTDGIHFTKVGNRIDAASSISGKFEYEFPVDKGTQKNYFFRIKKTNQAGKVFYTDVRSIAINLQKLTSGKPYPNPTVNGINLQFAKHNNGKYLVEMISSTGKKIFSREYKANGPTSINIEFRGKTPPGIYFVKVKDLDTLLEETSKLQVL